VLCIKSLGFLLVACAETEAVPGGPRESVRNPLALKNYANSRTWGRNENWGDEKKNAGGNVYKGVYLKGGAEVQS